MGRVGSNKWLKTTGFVGRGGVCDVEPVSAADYSFRVQPTRAGGIDHDTRHLYSACFTLALQG